MALRTGYRAPPVICLDGRNLALPQGTGVSNYAIALSEQITNAGHQAGLLLDAPADTLPRPGRARRWLRAASPLAHDAVRQQTSREGFAESWVAVDVFRTAQVHVDMYRRPLMIRSRRPPDLMHWTYPLPLRFADVPNVYTIHDLIPLTAPGLVDTNVTRFGRIVRDIARRADHIVTVSESSRRDIIRLLGVPEYKVTNTFQPLNLPSQAAAPAAEQNYFLYCGTIEPRKNVRRLIAAYRQSGCRTALVLAGPDGWRAEEELSDAKAAIRIIDERLPWRPLGEGGIWRRPWLPRPALIDLLRGARALLFPSLAEGFGLPVVEAMALGVPVMTSAGGATEEIAGQAALLVNPVSVSEMAQAITALDHDPLLRERLAAAGRRRAAAFSPDACLARLAPVYDALGATCP